MTMSIADLEDGWAELLQLRKLIELQGFKIIDGDFVMRDGSHSTVFLKPVDSGILLKLAREALQGICTHKNQWRFDVTLCVNVCRSCGARA